jgi:hypothetical protein
MRKNAKAIFIILALLMVTSVPLIQAVSLIIAECTITSNSSSSLSSINDSLGQTFISPSELVSLTYVEFNLTLGLFDTSTTNLTVNLYTISPTTGKITIPALVTSNQINASTITHNLTGASYKFYFSNVYLLTPNTFYGILLEPEGGVIDGSHGITMLTQNIDATAIYPGCHIFYRFTTQTFINYSTTDAICRIYGDTPPIPEAEEASNTVFGNMYLAVGLVGVSLIVLACILIIKSLESGVTDGLMFGVLLLIGSVISLVVGFVIVARFEGSMDSLLFVGFQLIKGEIK